MGPTFRQRGRRGLINLDWMLTLVAVLAAALLAATVIRTDASDGVTQFGRFVGGMRSLAPNERLVLFEDGESGGTADWSAGRPYDREVGLGAIWLVDPGNSVVDRQITLPEETVRAIIRLDLIAIDDWALEGLELSLDGVTRLRHRISSRPDLIADQTGRTDEGGGVSLQSHVAAPRDLGFAGGMTALAETRVVVEMAIDTPDAQIDLSIAPIPAAGAEAAADFPSWAIDNLIVVAARLP
jgi:hypothetical protein